MPRPLSIALIAVLCLASTAKAEDKPSPAVKRVLDKAVGKVRANRTEFDKANKKPLDEARAELQEVVTKLNKDGKTKEAIDTLKQVETLEADVMKMANTPLANQQRASAPSPVGKWSWPDDSGHWIQLQPNGGAIGSWHQEQGLWTSTSDGQVRMIVMRTRSVVDCTMSADGTTMARTDGKLLKRIP